MDQGYHEPFSEHGASLRESGVQAEGWGDGEEVSVTRISTR